MSRKTKRYASMFYVVNIFTAIAIVVLWTYANSSKNNFSSKTIHGSWQKTNGTDPFVIRVAYQNKSWTLSANVNRQNSSESNLKIFGTTFDANNSPSGIVTQSAIEATKVRDITSNNVKQISTASDNLSCSSSCSPINWSEEIQPLIRLDPDRFLYPGLVAGPNNQLCGLWDSIYLAIRLNRTFVVPYFYKHHSSGQEYLTPDERIDVNHLRQFASCASVEQLREKCASSFDVVFRAAETPQWTMERFEANTGMNIFRVRTAHPITNRTEFGTQSPTKIASLPSEKYKPRYGSWIASDEKTIRDAFGTSARCAIFTSPFKSVNVRLSNNQARSLPFFKSSNINISRVPDEVLFSAVVDAVRRPPCVVATASDYITTVFRDEPYVAVHWRYDKDDWYKWHCIRSFQSSYSTACKHLLNITAHDVAHAIEGQMRQWGVTGRRFIYIASPPFLQNFTKKIYDSLETLFPMNESQTLISFLRNNYGNCWNEMASSMDAGEILSLTEMEIMVNSSWFFYSSKSTWSGNVKPLRHRGKINGTNFSFNEAEILKLATQTMLERTNGSI